MPLLKVGLCPALTQNVVESLASIGLLNVLNFVSTDLEEITAKSGVPFKDLCAIRKIALAQYAPFPVNALDVYEEIHESSLVLPTPCDSLNELLNDGLYCGELTEIIGKSAVGKTQICLATCVSVAQDRHKNVFYIDGSGGFDIHRIQDILEAKNCSEDSIMTTCKRIKSCPVFDVFELLAQLEQLQKYLSDHSHSFYGNLKLLIIDSVASVLSPIIGGQQSAGHSYLVNVAQSLRSLASEFGIAVMVTNNVTTDENGVAVPTLGRSWRSVPNVRILLERDYQDYSLSMNRGIKLIKSTRQPIGGKCSFSINDAGISSFP